MRGGASWCEAPIIAARAAAENGATPASLPGTVKEFDG